jgi:hypothetical protein
LSQAPKMTIALAKYMTGCKWAVENMTPMNKIAFYRAVIESAEPLGQNGLGPAIVAGSLRVIQQIERGEPQ